MTDFQIARPKTEAEPAKTNEVTQSSRDGATVIERLLGLTAAMTLAWCCMVLEGTHPQQLVALMPIAMVSAITLGGLIMSHGPRLVAKLVAVCFGASAANEAQATQLRSLCRRGRRLAYAGAVLQMITATMHVLSVLDAPSLIGPGIAQAFTGFVYALLISEFGFGAAEHWVNTRSKA